MKINKLNESMRPSQETLDDCLQDYLNNAFGYDGVEDYVDTQYPMHSQEFKAEVINYIKERKLNEGSIPRNASKIRATHRYGDKQSMELSKDGTYWRETNSNRAYPSDFLRRSFDIEMLETDPNYKPNRTKPEYVVQGNYGYGWEDLTASDDYSEARNDLKAYRENETGVPHRLITRRVPVTENLKEAFKPSNSGIQSVKCYNPYNYTIQELRVDNDNKTFERGNFTAGKPDKKTKNRQEFEDIVDTLKELGYTEIKSDYHSMRNKSRKGTPTSVEEGYELSPRIDYNPNHLRDDEGKIMADRWYASKWPDDEVGIEQLKGITLDDALKDRSILGHCDTQVRERVYAQLDRYIPLSVDSPMYKEKKESKSIKEARRKASDPKQIEKAEKSMFDSLMNGAYNTEWMIQDARMIYGISYDEAVKAFENAHNKYMIMSGELDESKEPINEASYGGAFDIADDQYFTREDLENAAEEVLNHINETFEEPYNLGGTWFEDGKWIVNVQDDGFNEYEVSVPVDMRKIREPWHLRRAYAGDVAAKLIAQIKEYNGLNEDTAVSSTFEFDDDVDDLSYYSEEDIIDALNDVWEEIASKQVPDSDGFLTDYTMYKNINTGEYVFVFGDKDIYRPEDGYFDWECETEEEAKEWFDNYVGFDDDLVDECWSSKLEEEAETSPIVHKKSDGSYLIQSDSGDGYTAFNKDNVCQGHISASNDVEAKNKFNSNKFDE